MSLFNQVGGRGVMWWVTRGASLCEKAQKKALIFLEKVPNLQKIPGVLQGFEEILHYKERFKTVTESELHQHCMIALPELVEAMEKMTDTHLLSLGVDAVVDWAHFLENLHREIPRTKITTPALLTPLQMILERT